jgi:hypothetical protein
MQAPLMMSLLFVYVLATTALALPQPHPSPPDLLPHATVTPGIADHPSKQRKDTQTYMHMYMQASKRTDSTGAGGQANVSSYFMNGCEMVQHGVNLPKKVYICEDVFWGGRCETKYYNLGTDECVTLDGRASSITPAPGFLCVFYKYVLSHLSLLYVLLPGGVRC